MTIYKGALLAIQFHEGENDTKQEIDKIQSLSGPIIYIIHATATELQELDTNNNNRETKEVVTERMRKNNKHHIQLAQL